MKKTGIYIIRNTINKKVYIGQSLDMVSRFTGHLYYLRHNTHWNIGLQSLYNKHGESIFNFSILETCHKKELDNKEKWYIEYYNSYKKGYNNTEGGKPSVPENIHNNKEKACKECGTPVKTKWYQYCDKHKYMCPKCKKRISYKHRICNECLNRKDKRLFVCENCNEEFEKNSNNQKYCDNCAVKIKKEQSRIRMANKRKKNKI